MEQSVKDRLKSIVGAENFTDSLIDLISYATDGSEHKHRPNAAVWPTSTDHVSEVLKLANVASFPVVPRGAGTGLAGLAVPVRGGVVLDMGRMNKILEINVEDRLVVVQPGVVYATLEKALTPHGFFYPPTRQVVWSAPWGEMWPPTQAGSKAQNMAPPKTMSWPWKWCCPMETSCAPVPDA